MTDRDETDNAPEITAGEGDQARTKARLEEVEPEDTGQRLDNFLMRVLKGLPKSRVYRIIRKGEVRVNGGRAKPADRLVAGDKVRIPPLAPLKVLSVAVGNIKDLDKSILYEDKYILIINKPAGMAVHGGSGVSVGVIESIRHAFPSEKQLELVHRLDKATSGCLMIAKNRRYLRLLQTALRRSGPVAIKKTYLALVHGNWPARLTSVDVNLETQAEKGGERYTRVAEAGKTAMTSFSVIASAGDTSLVHASPITGRTHQIRVHSQYARHPIVGDPKYGDPFRDHALSASVAGIPRMLLHARSLFIPALEDHDPIEVVAPVDQATSRILTKLYGEIDY